ncbi:hypothetical protein ACFY0F_23340 [Streptomyces sp. NPDC001544]|uniref:hypothetical protein n=1 Tax=Streptomyces sp. NPDC001544 TaxID=3364584 RepID=UPI0036A21C58
MDERRDTPPPPETRRPAALATGLGQLSPVQQAYADYVEHAHRCDDCRDIDSRCMAGDGLWRAYRERTDGAYRQLADESS